MFTNLVTFIGYTEQLAGPYKVLAYTYENAAVQIAELQDREAGAPALERIIELWPQGFPELKRCVRVGSKVVYVATYID